MKRTWKTFTTPVKRKAVKDVASLVAKGKSLSAAITGMNFFIPGIGNITLDHSTLQHIAQLTKYTS